MLFSSPRISPFLLSLFSPTDEKKRLGGKTSVIDLEIKGFSLFSNVSHCRDWSGFKIVLFSPNTAQSLASGLCFEAVTKIWRIKKGEITDLSGRY